MAWMNKPKEGDTMQLSTKRKNQLVVGPYTRLLAEHEKALADLYASIGVVLKSEKQFWQTISREELEHEQLILEIDEKLQSGEWSFKRPRFVTTAIAESIEWVNKLRENVESQGISMREALKLALEFETGMFEAKFFEIVNGDSPEMMNVLESLAGYSRGHVKRLQLEAKRLKWKILGGRKASPATVKHSASPSHDALKASVLSTQADLLGLMVSLEEAASSLYHVYSDRIQDSRDFWTKISSEETRHADMLRSLYKTLERGKVFYNLDRFKKENIQTDIDFIRIAEFDACHGRLTRHKAVNTALRLEMSITESAFYSTVESDAPEFKRIAEALVGRTREHIRQIEAETARIIDMGEKAADVIPLSDVEKP
jgi:rubrerythrin